MYKHSLYLDITSSSRLSSSMIGSAAALSLCTSRKSPSGRSPTLGGGKLRLCALYRCDRGLPGLLNPCNIDSYIHMNRPQIINHRGNRVQNTCDDGGIYLSPMTLGNSKGASRQARQENSPTHEN